MNNSFNLVIKK